ncbi:MAG: hypothetical protein ACREMG_08520, partial [Gemmatimonadales bacterium]
LVASVDQVRSEVSLRVDSLEVVVTWRVDRSAGPIPADSVRVEVGLSETHTARVSTRPVSTPTDTAWLAAPASGGTAVGYSCVAGIARGRLLPETCTPWQFVRPMAVAGAPDPKPGRARDTVTTLGGVTTAQVVRIVVQPGGLQVDPDEGGRCSEWQRQNPGQSVWLDVNREAIPPCTGPNGKPVVAQFCAFAVLVDGRRVKTGNSINNPYCDRLFQEWVRERFS